ncbi:MAG TPA: HAD family hydrolase [Acidimicrobiia bacterium]|nr:HAD family hydrolase [Acidimicrobiia bacterium]
MKRPLTDYRAISFDCYGTLIDWETGIWDALQPLLAANGRADLVRGAALHAFATHESDQQSRTPDLPYPRILELVHRAMAAELALATTDELDTAFGASLPHWPAFADSADSLRYLQMRYRLVILSNVDRAGFGASSTRLGVEFAAVYTAEDIGSYKPIPSNFEFMLARLRDRFGLHPPDVLHAAQSLFHDHVPAMALGLSTAWIDRNRQSQGGDRGATAQVAEQPRPDYVFFSMADMVRHIAASGETSTQ